MNRPDIRSTLATAAVPSLLGALLIAGCNKGAGNGSAGGENDVALVSAGQAVFSAKGCANCHSVNGQGGRRAPDLTHVGANPQHTPDWLVAHVKNPRSQNPSSRMPAFEGKISDNDLRALGAYLASLK